MPYIYLEEFEKLPENLKKKVSLKEILELESSYKVDLKDLVMGVMVKEMKLEEIEEYLKRELKVSPEKISKIRDELIEKVFKSVLEYLKRPKEMTVEDLTEKIIKSQNLSFPDEAVKKRFLNIVVSRIKSVRDDIETKNILLKSEKLAGMGLDEEKANGVLEEIKKYLGVLISEEKEKESREVSTPPVPPAPPVPPKEPRKIIPSEESRGGVGARFIEPEEKEEEEENEIATSLPPVETGVAPRNDKISPPLKEEIKRLRDEEIKPREEGKEEIKRLRDEEIKPREEGKEEIKRLRDEEIKPKEEEEKKEVRVIHELPKMDFEKMAELIVKDKAPEENLQERLKNVIISYLKDVRDEIEARGILLRPKEFGGIGLDEETAQEIMTKAEERKKEVGARFIESKEKEEEKTAGVIEEEKIFPEVVSAAAFAPSLSALGPPAKGKEEIKRLRDEEIKPKEEEEEEKKEIATSLPPVETGVASRNDKISPPLKEEIKRLRDEEIKPREEGKEEIKRLRDEEIKPKEEEEKKEVRVIHELPKSPEIEDISRGKEKPVVPPPIPPKIEIPHISVPPPPSITKEVPSTPPPLKRVERPTEVEGVRPKVVDIKSIPHLVGPVEELKDLTVKDLRRISEDPQKGMEKIQEKINLLEEEEGFSKRITGINAWQKSEIYRLYVEMGQESMEKKLPLQKVIEERKAQSKPFLSEAEFNAVMDLNKKLRF